MAPLGMALTLVQGPGQLPTLAPAVTNRETELLQIETVPPKIELHFETELLLLQIETHFD